MAQNPGLPRGDRAVHGLSYAGNGAYCNPGTTSVWQTAPSPLVGTPSRAGPAPTGEWLADGGRVLSIERGIANRRKRYGTLNPAAVERVGGRHRPALPIEVVR
jgi:hypothetical protein